MTIPIAPGPFSFLENIGKGIANYGQGKEYYRTTQRKEGQEDRAESFKMLDFLFKGIQSGDFDASIVKKPGFLKLVQGAGLGEGNIGEDTVVPNPQAQIRRGQSAALEQEIPQILQGGSQYGRQRLARGEIATAPETAQARAQTAVGNTQAQTVEQGGAAGRAAAGVLDPTVAAALEESQKEPLYNQVAERSVDASITNLKLERLDQANIGTLSEQAWGLAEQDAKSRGLVLTRELTKPYIDAVIRRRLFEQQQMDLQKEVARMRQQAGGLDTDALIRIQQRQSEILNNMLKTVPQPDIADVALAADYDSKVGAMPPEQRAQFDATPDAALGRAASMKVKTYHEAVGRITAQSLGMLDETQRLLQGTVGSGGPIPGRSANKLTEAQIAERANMLAGGTGTDAQLTEAVNQGLISNTDAQEIRSRAKRQKETNR